MKAIERIKWLAYGNHPQTAKYRKSAETILEHLRNQGATEKSELAEAIGLNTAIESEDRKFKRIMQPLKGDNDSNPLDISFIYSYQDGHDRYYELSRPAFDASLKVVKKNLRDFLGE